MIIYFTNYLKFHVDHSKFVSIMYVRHKTKGGVYKVTLDFEGQELNRLLVDLGYARAEADTTLYEQMLDDSSNLGEWFCPLAYSDIKEILFLLSYNGCKWYAII